MDFLESPGEVDLVRVPSSVVHLPAWMTVLRYHGTHTQGCLFSVFHLPSPVGGCRFHFTPSRGRSKWQGTGTWLHISRVSPSEPVRCIVDRARVQAVGPVDQGVFLQRMGILHRLEALLDSLSEDEEETAER